MKVTIERESCTMCAVCWEICPEVFEENQDDGFSQIVTKYRIDDQIDYGNIPETYDDCVTEAVDSCPVEIIHIEEE
jgi:ferredoxin